MKVTIAQMNPIVGDIKGNLLKMKEVLGKNVSDLVIFPELFLTGYPPRDLLTRKKFIERTQEAVQEIISFSSAYPKKGILFGTVLPTEKDYGRGLYNSAVLVCNGKVLAKEHKTLLPRYNVSDDAQYFDPAPEIDTVPFKDEVLGISVGEDAWKLAKKGATVLINISASPFAVGKEQRRFDLIRHHAVRHHLPCIFVNQVGGNDELIFDGRSMCVDRDGNLTALLPSFKERTETIDLAERRSIPFTPEEKIASVYKALVLGTRDYMRKCGFTKAVLGLSGGIDSAVTCCIATDAVGSENVLGVTMPSPYSSEGSVTDSRELAENLGVEFKKAPISPIFSSYLEMLKEEFKEKRKDTTEENIQARIRGNILMALSNKFGHLVLSSGNKSELAVGYCTLYGDMAGGLAVLSDVPKTMVYELAAYINRKTAIIPQATIEKPPSAELKSNQRDQDILPPYPILDRILHLYVDEGHSLKEIINEGIDVKMVRWVINAVKQNEYKRRQAPPGLKATTKAFGMGRKMPIAAKYDI